MNLHGKVALITGGRRVGGELAKLLASRGMSIALTYKTRPEAIEQTLEEIRTQGGKGFAISADLSDALQAEQAVVETVNTVGRLDVLVNMASVYRRTPFEELTANDFSQMIANNLAAPYFTSLFAARQMRRQAVEEGLKGKIVNVGDWATDRPYRHYLPYLTAKGALKTFTLALAKELAPDVTVNLVQPAMIDPPPDFTEDDKAAVLALTPLHRLGTPGDLNRLILYLLEGTDFVTGSCYRVDGGRFLGVNE